MADGRDLPRRVALEGGVVSCCWFYHLLLCKQRQAELNTKALRFQIDNDNLSHLKLRRFKQEQELKVYLHELMLFLKLLLILDYFLHSITCKQAAAVCVKCIIYCCFYCNKVNIFHILAGTKSSFCSWPSCSDSFPSSSFSKLEK